ncbi:unnamed protein product [Closterium sp. NIES-53]
MAADRRATCQTESVCPHDRTRELEGPRARGGRGDDDDDDDDDDFDDDDDDDEDARRGDTEVKLKSSS